MITVAWISDPRCCLEIDFSCTWCTCSSSEVYYFFWLNGSLAKSLDNSSKRARPHLCLLPCSFLSMLVSVYFRIFSSNRMKVVLVSATLMARTQQRRNSSPLYCPTPFFSKDKEEKVRQKLESMTRRKSIADLFYEGCSPWQGASFLHTICTSPHSGTRPCRYFADTSSRGGPVQSTQNTTRRVKGCLAVPAADTVQDCVFASHTGSRCRQQ